MTLKPLLKMYNVDIKKINTMNISMLSINKLEFELSINALLKPLTK